MTTSRWRTRAKRAAQGLGALLVVAIAVALVVGWSGFGKAASGARLERMKRSPEWKDGVFVNPQPIINDLGKMFGEMWHMSEHVSPDPPIHFPPVDPSRFRTPPASGLRVTWFGHSSTLIEIDGHRVLTDPMWSERATPIPGFGPKRWFAPLIALGDFPKIDAVVISHDHYDHLDRGTIVAMKDWDTTFVVPLGVGAHLEYWGVPASRIVELDWWQKTRVRELDIVCTPSRHASGRHVLDRDTTLWASYAFVGSAHRAYFSGDTGVFPAMTDIGERYGPFDVTLIETGQYGSGWPDWHIGPEQAVTAHGMLRGRVLFPIHWALLGLAYHGWTEPIERTLAATSSENVTVVAPRPGESVEPAAPPPVERWWPNIPWKTGAESPIVSSGMGPTAESERH